MPTLANKQGKVKFIIGTATIDKDGKVTEVATVADLTPVLKGLPDFAENKEQVEDTILDSDTKTYIEGLKDYGQLEFTCNFHAGYAKKVKDNLTSLTGVKVVLADETTIMYGISDISITINAASSGALMEMTIATFVSTDLKYN